MRKVLIITYYWPPAGGPGVQRWLYFVRYLAGMGIQPVLFLPEHPHYPLQDPELEALVPEGISVYRSSFWEPYRLAALLGRKTTHRVSAGMIDKKDPGWAERLMRWIRGNFFIPDARRFWIRPALQKLPAILEKERPDWVITTGPPHSLHLIGLGLKKRLDIRWAADFRDPWTGIGYHDFMFPGSRARRRHRDFERQVLQHANVVITTSRKTAESFREQTAVPVHVVTNGYNHTPASGDQPEGPFRIVHTGSLLGGRNPENLWAVLQELLQEEAGLVRDLRLEFTGLVSAEVRQSLETAGLNAYSNFHPYVPHKQAMAQMREAQVLLLPEIDSAQTREILPGKLFEYMAAARPILAIGPDGWEAAQLVEETGCGVAFTYQERATLKAHLRKWYQAYKAGALRGDPPRIEGYHRKALTEKLVNEVLWVSS
ncbi:glycosyltransferase family 4 protein [Robiginitalea sp. M366]|uniref:glycosyltransferase family 4 protein n=1 Tax=Robiginitalea aestuariiviva TaxID=3036903 RepID=UPI00240D2E75|nr:glycosyltransferase family 4 protein [Robiginitalea aestuariiviva]MDG1573034.1 glycosyltransferase family 4 protein [Robiginitalea aestuariiviva]